MVKVKLFGLYRLDTGLKELEVDAARVRDIYPVLLQKAKELDPDTKVTAKDIGGCIVVVNGVQTNKRAPLQDGDTVLLMSPVCGG